MYPGDWDCSSGTYSFFSIVLFRLPRRSGLFIGYVFIFQHGSFSSTQAIGIVHRVRIHFSAWFFFVYPGHWDCSSGTYIIFSMILFCLPRPLGLFIGYVYSTFPPRNRFFGRGLKKLLAEVRGLRKITVHLYRDMRQRPKENFPLAGKMREASRRREGGGGRGAVHEIACRRMLQ